MLTLIAVTITFLFFLLNHVTRNLDHRVVVSHDLVTDLMMADNLLRVVELRQRLAVFEIVPTEAHLAGLVARLGPVDWLADAILLIHSG